MKKSMNRISFYAVMAGVIFMTASVFSSCGSKQSDYKSVIPKDAPLVLEVDMKSLTLKSNILSYKGLVADIMESGAPENDVVMKFADELREADDGGMNFNTPFYVFTNADMDGVFITTAVKRREEVTDLLLSIRQLDLRVVEDEARGWAWIESNSTATPIGLLTDNMLFVGITKHEKLFEQMMENGGGFFGTKMGEALRDHRGDISLAMNLETLSAQGRKHLAELLDRVMEKTGERATTQVTAQLVANLSQSQAILNLQFQKGQIALNTFDVKGTKMPHCLKKINPEVFDHIPAQDIYGMAAIGIEGPKLHSYINDMLENGGFSMLPNEVRIGLRVVANILKESENTLVFAAYPGEKKMPKMLGLLPVNMGSCQFIVNMLTSGDDKGIYMDGNANWTSLSNMQDYRFDAVQQPLNIGERAASSYIYGYLNLNLFINRFLAEKRRGISHRDMQLFDAFAEYMNKIDFAELKVEDYDEASIILVMKDRTRNSLDLLITGAFELGMKFYIYEGQHGRELHAVSAPDVDPFEEEWEALIDW